MNMRDMAEFFVFIFAGVCGFVAAAFFCLLIYAGAFGPQVCTAFGEGMNTKTEYRFWYGCFVTMSDGRVLPESIARDVLRQEYRLEINKR